MGNDGYSDYWDWYDNGPGSESWKRKLREEEKCVGHDFLKWPEWKIRAATAAVGMNIEKKKEKEEFIKDEDILI